MDGPAERPRQTLPVPDPALTTRSGGAEGIRTPDPLLAKQVLSRLSYDPTIERRMFILTCRCADDGKGDNRPGDTDCRHEDA